VLHSDNLTINLHVNAHLFVPVLSDVPSPSVSPCGICRQFIREFCSLDTPIYMVGSNYTESDKEVKDDGETMVMKTLEELLPMSFGPEFLGKKKV
jgi:cytidine deaminase